MTRVCITGGGGFIGSNVADRLVRDGAEVVVIDDFRTGRREFIEHLLSETRFTLIEADVLDKARLRDAIDGSDWVFHLQANADVRHGLEHPTLDLEQNTLTTSLVLETMRAVGTTKILFSSTGSMYGEPEVFPTPEDAPLPVQTSLYGASKLAAEGLIGAYSAGFGFTGVICRFVSILGEHYNHGHVIDFFRALNVDPSKLTVLGDGKQEKSYLYIGDCVEALMVTSRHHDSDMGTFVYNLGTDETLIVDESVTIIADYLGLNPIIEHTGGKRGWIGDSPLIRLDTSKLRALGWAPTLSIKESVVATLTWMSSAEYLWKDPASANESAR